MKSYISFIKYDCLPVRFVCLSVCLSVYRLYVAKQNSYPGGRIFEKYFIAIVTETRRGSVSSAQSDTDIL